MKLGRVNFEVHCQNKMQESISEILVSQRGGSLFPQLTGTEMHLDITGKELTGRQDFQKH